MFILLIYCCITNYSKPNVFKRFYLFIFREEKEGRKGGRETSMCGCLLSALYWGPGLQPWHVPWLGIKLATFCFICQSSTHWATPATAPSYFLNQGCFGPYFKPLSFPQISLLICSTKLRAFSFSFKTPVNCDNYNYRPKFLFTSVGHILTTPRGPNALAYFPNSTVLGWGFG